jgi:hypothetical protein
VKSLVFVVLFLASCDDTPQSKVVEVSDRVCIEQCSLSFWTGKPNADQFAICKELHKGQKCCAVMATNSGHNLDGSWTAGQIGRTTGCPK